MAGSREEEGEEGEEGEEVERGGEERGGDRRRRKYYGRSSVEATMTRAFFCCGSTISGGSEGERGRPGEVMVLVEEVKEKEEREVEAVVEEEDEVCVVAVGLVSRRAMLA